MPKFFYVAKNQTGQVKNGTVEAAEEREIVDDLKKEGYWVVSLKQLEGEKSKAKKDFFSSFLKVPLKNKMIFCRHLAVMIASGVSLSKALNILGSQEKNKGFQRIIRQLSTDVKNGISLADAAGKYPTVFDSVFVSMIRVGEMGGNLVEILNILTSQMEKDHKLISKIRGAMIYPAIIFAVMIVMGILMMMFVVPKITAVFKDFDAELPFMTKMVIGISDFMAGNIFLTLGGIAAIVVSVRYFSKTLPGKKLFHKFFLNAPIFGIIVVKVNSARFARILSSLLGSGVALVESLKITSDTLGNYYFKQATLKASSEVQRGVPLSQVLYSYRNTFPYLVVQMVEVGEETGKTEQVLLNLASFYEEEVDQISKNLSSVIEPVLMIIIGAAVGVFAISMIQPIYSIMGKM